MENVEIIPLTGIKIDDKIISLSTLRENVEDLLGAPCRTWKNSLYYFNNELRFDFDENGRVDFIEFLAGADGEIQPQIYGVYVFQTEADDLYDILKEKNNGEIDDHENGYSYGFLNISVGVFRDAVPEAVQEMIEEAAADGEPMDADDVEYEMRKAKYWATIGIGVKDYYRKA